MSATGKHTAGPWEEECFPFGIGKSWQVRGATHVVARVLKASGFNADQTAQANACLIAAAPDLLAALVECLSRLKMDLEEVRHLRQFMGDAEREEREAQDEAADDADEEAIARAEAAVARATGQS